MLIELALQFVSCCRHNGILRGWSLPQCLCEVILSLLVLLLYLVTYVSDLLMSHLAGIEMPDDHKRMI